ncbi:DUF485 domain-containing protein [Amycolatopsis sp. YIM 10]|uniref:DUF485 domain-containing protein n=1 Tax=Amycolatopsis sp. YIM 10 TaxID=2653857 RepID=UPI0012906627|nr:DUF485 domain-containing protein [Amycolatopsis sp. YIM 10]QFU88049.1 hypothetical protein YIM_14315 [Amycolatopsis sp. YIM 10]
MPELTNEPHARNAMEDTGQLPIMFGGPGPSLLRDEPAERTGPDYEAIQRSPEFTGLRSRLRRFIFPVSLLFFAWYLAFVLLAAYAHEFMSTRVFGSVNVAMLLGLAQFASTVLITAAYLRFANRRLDPQVAAIRRSVDR